MALRAALLIIAIAVPVLYLIIVRARQRQSTLSAACSYAEKDFNQLVNKPNGINEVRRYINQLRKTPQCDPLQMIYTAEMIRLAKQRELM